MKHDLLDPHQIIAWDMDQTLVNGPYSEFFRAYIQAHPEKEHHIVTFRTGAAQRFAGVDYWHDECHHELDELGIPHGTIRAVHGIPDRLYHSYAQQRSFYRPDEVKDFLMWKGKKAHEIGATVLVDDMGAMVIQGCEHYGVAFVDSHDERFAIPV